MNKIDSGSPEYAVLVEEAKAYLDDHEKEIDDRSEPTRSWNYVAARLSVLTDFLKKKNLPAKEAHRIIAELDRQAIATTKQKVVESATAILDALPIEQQILDQLEAAYAMFIKDAQNANPPSLERDLVVFRFSDGSGKEHSIPFWMAEILMKRPRSGRIASIQAMLMPSLPFPE